jgi:hypothetical protein
MDPEVKAFLKESSDMLTASELVPGYSAVDMFIEWSTAKGSNKGCVPGFEVPLDVESWYGSLVMNGWHWSTMRLSMGSALSQEAPEVGCAFPFKRDADESAMYNCPRV